MNTLNHLINSRILTTLYPLTKELELDPQKNYLFDLSYLGVLDLKGEKAREFLQGQLTADMNKVSDIQMIQAAQCNLKGRILALIDVIHWNGWKLVIPCDILEQTKNSLAKVGMLSRVSIHEMPNVLAFGFYLQSAKDLLPYSLLFPSDLYSKAEGNQFCYYHLGSGFYVFIVDKGVAEQLMLPFIEKEQLLGSLTWHTLRLYKQELTIYPESRGIFLPHRLNLHQTQYLSFDKGCYKGQEIIARTHYKATPKHELRTYVINTQHELFSGQKLFKVDANIEIGELVDYSILGDHHYLIAVSIRKEASLEVRLENDRNYSRLLSCNTLKLGLMKNS